LAAQAFAFGFVGCGEGVETLPNREAYRGTRLPVGCLPNLDGRIDAEEMPVVIGLPLDFRISPAGAERVVDLVGRTNADGLREWEWNEDTTDDERLRVEGAAVAARWYASDFTGAELALAVAPTGAPGDIEAIYRKDEEALWLLGYATREAQPPEGATLMVYDPPVALFRFPIEPGAAWISVGQVRDGLVRGLPYASDDTYDVEVPAAGRLVLPDLTFTQAHQVRTRLTVAPAFGTGYALSQATFVFECFGEVARATSRRDETRDPFSIAAEVRRLGL
jgi:hypothetical protein